MSPRWVNVIDARQARRLRRGRLSWAAVGRELARLQGRSMPYLSLSVRNAVYNYERGRRPAIPGFDDYMEA